MSTIASLVVLVVKNLPTNACNEIDVCFHPWVGKIPSNRKWRPTPVFLPGKFHGLRSLAGYGPGDHRESNTTEYTRYYSLS